jgi:hypothetical protein
LPGIKEIALRTNVTLEAVLEFLQDENLGPYKVKHKGDKWSVNFNEPAEWGTADSRGRCGIGIKEIKGVQVVVFNGFKAHALYGEDYKGDIFKFVKLIKGFSTWTEAKDYFTEKYLLQRDITEVLSSSKKSYNQEPKVKSTCDFPLRFERFDKEKHQPYYEYLVKERKISPKKIDKLKLFVDPEQKRVIFPVYENGELIFYSGRDITGMNIVPWLKSKGEGVYPIWNLENVLGTTVSVFEGIGDAIYLSNGVALFGVGSEEHFKKILRRCFTKIILIFDNDTAGRRAKIKWAQWLSDHNHPGVYIYDFSGIKVKDFGKMAELGIDFEVSERIFPWTYKTEMMCRMGKII